MKRIIIEKIIHKDFGALTAEELKAIMNNDDIFLLSKKDKKILKPYTKKINCVQRIWIFGTCIKMMNQRWRKRQL